METESANRGVDELKGHIKKTWVKLTDGDLESFRGESDEIVKKVQKAYGYTKDRAQQEVDSFIRSHSYFFRDNRGIFNQETYMASTGQFSEMEKNKLRSRASHLIEEDLIEPTQQYIAKAREFGSRAVDRGTEIVRENPGYTILGAAAVGFLLGAYVARRR